MALDETKAILPRDLRTYDGPLFVRNNTNTLISFDDFNKNVLTLSPNGTDGDYDALDRAIAMNTNFQKFWRQGGVSIFPEGHGDDELDAQERRIREALERKNSTSGGDLGYYLEEPSTNKDLTQFQCIEPGCGTPVFLSNSDIANNSKPPLCNTHEILSDRYSYSEYQNAEGDVVSKWTTASVNGLTRDTIA